MDESTPQDLIAMGGSVKAIGGGVVDGYLVRFSSAEDTDLTGDFFTKDTDFGLDFGKDVPLSCRTLYHHGQDEVIGKKCIGMGSLKKDDVGIWISAQLEKRDEYEEAVYKLAEKKKLGWSSGTASHLVERKAHETTSGKRVYEITHWPLGLDASLTVSPAESRNSVVALKSLSAFLQEAEVASLEGSPELKAAHSEAERKKHATVTRDNDHSTTAYYRDGKAYMLPIPPGDKNAAKVALSEMYSYPLTEAERKSVHDTAAKELGAEHEKSYCGYCYDTMKSATGGTPALACKYDTTLLVPSGDGKHTLKYLGEIEMDTQKALDALAEQMKTLTGAVTTLASTVTTIAEKQGAAEAKAATPPPAPETPPAAPALDPNAGMLEQIKGLIEGLAKPLPRTQQSVPAGAAAAKTAPVEFEGELDSKQQKMVESYKSFRTRFNDIKQKREDNIQFTAQEQADAERVAVKYDGLKCDLKYAGLLEIADQE